MRTLINTKYNVSLLKIYLKSNETKVMCDKKLPPCAIYEQSHDTGKVDPPN